MPSLQPFCPSGNTTLITVASSSAAVALTGTGDQVMVTSLAANAIAYFAFGASSVAVVIPTNGTPANGIPILPGQTRIFTCPPGSGYVATIGTAGNTLTFTRGDGA